MVEVVELKFVLTVQLAGCGVSCIFHAFIFIFVVVPALPFEEFGAHSM